MIPYRDENSLLRTPIVTLTIVGMNAFAWVTLQGAGAPVPLARSICDFGLIAGALTATVPAGTRFPVGAGVVCATEPGPQILPLFTSMFMHGSWLHIVGNMWFLWLFGNNVEDSMGRLRFVVFYLLTGLAAAFGQIATNPASAVPMVGASGAISGVMGAYLVLYPNVRVYTLVPIGFFITSIALPAWMMLGYWLLLQFIGGLAAVGVEGGGVAFWAHIGGFVAGVAFIKLFARSDYITAHRARHWRPRHVMRGW